MTLEALGPDRTRLTFVHHLGASDQAEQIGPGWEYYLDRLDASRADQPMPDFGDYWPSMGPYYAAQDRGLGRPSPPAAWPAAPARRRRPARRR